MNRRTVAYLAALSLGACLPSLAFAQYYPPGAQIYREPAAPGYRGLPPSWLVDDDDPEINRYLISALRRVSVPDPRYSNPAIGVLALRVPTP